MNIYIMSIIGAIVGYLIGSIPFALIIGKIFYKTDVRKEGSGNLGATNVARTLGPVAGFSVLLFDMVKSGLTALIMYYISKSVLDDNSNLELIFCITGIAVSIGHCYPIFANFKGGKAVSTISGFVLFSNWKLFLIGLFIFVMCMIIFKIVSIGSMTMVVVVSICSFIPILGDCYLFDKNLIYSLTVTLLSIILIIKHIPNIKRLIHHEEKQFKFGHREVKK